MSRFPVAAAFLLFAAVAAPSTPAHASTVVSGQIGGEELFPDTADVLRETAALKSELRQSMAVARQLGDRGMAAQIQAMWQKVQGMESEALTRLRQANTTVYLYGAVAGRRDRASIIKFLLDDQRWRHASVHIYYRNGVEYWSHEAPHGYDGANDAARPTEPAPRPQSGRLGQTITVGNMKVVPLAGIGSTPPVQPKPTPPLPPHEPAPRGTPSHTVWGF